MRRGACIWGLIFGTRAALAIFFLGERLIPDTSEYAHGRAWWSSPLGAIVGSFTGMMGLRIFGVVTAIGVGVLVGAFSKRWWIPGAIFLSPPGWYTMQPAVDSGGAIAAGLANRSKSRHYLAMGIAVSSVHLAAGLVYLFSAMVKNVRPAWNWAGCVGGIGACLGEYHFQARYFLPGVVMLVVH